MIFTKKPKLYDKYTNFGIENTRIFGVLVCIHELVPNDIHWKDFVDELELLIEKYPVVKIETMGFPENWKDFLIK